MLNDRNRLLELALESLINKKEQLDEEIAEITRELRGSAAKQAPAQKIKAGATKRHPRFSKEERLKRSLRMKEYWENRRKKKAHQQ